MLVLKVMLSLSGDSENSGMTLRVPIRVCGCVCRCVCM